MCGVYVEMAETPALSATEQATKRLSGRFFVVPNKEKTLEGWN